MCVRVVRCVHLSSLLLVNWCPSSHLFPPQLKQREELSERQKTKEARHSEQTVYTPASPLTLSSSDSVLVSKPSPFTSAGLSLSVSEVLSFSSFSLLASSASLSLPSSPFPVSFSFSSFAAVESTSPSFFSRTGDFSDSSGISII